MDRDARQWLALLEEMADEADALALRYFRSRALRIDEKPDHTLVTEADRAIEAMVRDAIRQRCPELGVFGEEEGEGEGEAGGRGDRLIVDPIDATANFVRGIPVFASLLAIEVAGDVVAGVVSAPALQSRWRAARGGGAYSGSRRIGVSRVATLADAQLFHGNLGGRSEADPPRAASELMRRVQRTRGFGDFYQHTLVAEGAGEVALDPAVEPWDVAPIVILVEEAGGRATSLSGERTIYGRSLVSSNGLLHDECLRILAGPLDARAARFRRDAGENA